MAYPIKKTSWAQGIYDVSVVQLEQLGNLRILDDGRKFRYAKAAGTVGNGKALEATYDADANMVAQAPPTIAIGAVAFTFVPGGNVTYLENELAGGFVITTEATGLGQTYKIAGNTAEIAGTSLPITLEDPFVTATDTANTKMSVYPSVYSAAIIAATITNPILGIATQPLAAGDFAWIQTSGPCACLIAGTPAIGSYVIANATDGSLGIGAMAVSSPLVGVVINTAGATGKYYMVDLKIDG
jgi:hypothetical protein